MREQNPVIRVDRDHDHRWVGEVVFLARHGGRLLAVGEVDGVAEALNVRVGGQTVAVPTPLYWSATRIIGSPDDGLLLDSVSLTASPASVHPRPVTFLEGSLDHRAAAQRWRSKLDRVEFTLLERAANARADRRRGDAILIDELGDPKGGEAREGQPLDRRENRRADRHDLFPVGTVKKHRRLALLRACARFGSEGVLTDRPSGGRYGPAG
jgi:hypothetical protein